MVKRLLEVKSALIEVLTEVKIDTLLVAKWTRLEQLTSLLEPFSPNVAFSLLGDAVACVK